MNHTAATTCCDIELKLSRMQLAFASSILLLLLGSGRVMAAEVTEFYDVSMDGKKFTINGGAATNLNVGGKTVAVLVERAKFKRFDDGTISFVFPSDHAVKKEEDNGVTSWTLDGQDTVLMIHKLTDMDSKTFACTIIKELLKTYGDDSKTEGCERHFGSKLIKGKRIKATLAGETIVQDVFEFSAGSASYVWVIQDSEKGSVEGRLVSSKLKETFKISSRWSSFDTSLRPIYFQ